MNCFVNSIVDITRYTEHSVIANATNILRIKAITDM